MHLVLNKHGKIVASANYAINEADCAKREEKVIYIDDVLYKSEMVGCLYIPDVPYYVLPPTPFHVIENGEYVFTENEVQNCWQTIRRMRNNLLTLTDWTQLQDAQQTLSDEQKEHWQMMRTNLRNITQFEEPLSAYSTLNTYASEIIK